MSSRIPTLRAGALGLCALASVASAQQFVYQTGWIPGPDRWTEGVEPADVDNDGDIDLFFADGDGFSSAGTKRQNVLVINRLEISAGNFVDESTLRLGSHSSNAKSVCAGDIQNDGWVDALFSNGFNTDLPFLYVNRGAAQPGYFDFEGSARGFNEALSSANAQFGDVDNDGDMDVIITDSGSSFLGGSGARPRLYLNDGTGNYTEAGIPEGWRPSPKKAQMAVQLVDLDNDWDLDFLGLNRASNTNGNHYLMWNDGLGAYTDDSTAIPATSSSVYEADVADLDNDSDLDMFFTSLSSFNDGPMTNNLVPSGSFSLTVGAASGGTDDNEIALLDYDMDGDLDAIVGSLGSTERMYVNNGSAAFTSNTSIIQSVGDSTLDCTVADMNGDGAYDIVTAQGESGPSQYRNKIYLNNGPADNLPPTIVREEDLDAAGGSPWVVRNHVQDQVMDDRNNWVTGSASYVMTDASATANVTMAGITYIPALLSIPAGTTVIWDNPTTITHTVTSTTPGYSFDSGDMFTGDTYSHTFVTPGTYDYECLYHATFGHVGQIVVTGAANQADATYSGGGIWRFSMDDTSGGTQDWLAYETRFVDFVGNVTVSDSRLEYVGPCGFEKYSEGISPVNSIALEGSGSTSIGGAFSADSSNINGTFAVTLFTAGALNVPLFGGVLLVDISGPAVLVTSGVVAGATSVGGNLPNNPAHIGATLYLQSVAPDAGQPQGLALSNGLELHVCP